MKLKDILLELLDEQQDDRCLRIARRKYDKPSAYRSGAIVQCRKGKIWKGLKEDESLHKWFSRKGAGGKSKGWVDCNTCKEDPKTGRKKCKSCGRQKGENRAKYPSCRPTPSRCGDPGKGKKWGKTNEDYNEPSLITEITDNQILFFITKPNGKFGLVPFDKGFSNSYKKNTGAKMTTNFVNSINKFIKKLNPNSSMKAVLDNIYGTVRFVNIK